MTYFLGGIVLAGLLAALAQVMSLRYLSDSQYKLNVKVKKDPKDEA